jgi:hypothetical protein
MVFSARWPGCCRSANHKNSRFTFTASLQQRLQLARAQVRQALEEHCRPDGRLAFRGPRRAVQESHAPTPTSRAASPTFPILNLCRA